MKAKAEQAGPPERLAWQGIVRRLFANAGFAKARFYAGARGVFMRVPFWLVAFVESVLGVLPNGRGKLIAETGPMQALLGLRVAAVRPRDR